MSDAFLMGSGLLGNAILKDFSVDPLTMQTTVGTTQTRTINKVNVDKSIVIPLGPAFGTLTGTSYEPRYWEFLMTFVDETTIQAERGSSGVVGTCPYMVLEFPTAKFKQTGTISSPSGTETEITLTQAVDPDKTIILVTWKTTQSSWANTGAYFALYPSGSGNEEISIAHVNGTTGLAFNYQVLELR